MVSKKEEMMRRALAMTLFIFASVPAHACTVCFGDASSNMVKALWPGMYLLLGLIALMLGAIAWIGFSWVRRDGRQVQS